MSDRTIPAWARPKNLRPGLYIDLENRLVEVVGQLPDGRLHVKRQGQDRTMSAMCARNTLTSISRLMAKNMADSVRDVYRTAAAPEKPRPTIRQKQNKTDIGGTIFVWVTFIVFALMLLYALDIGVF